MRLVDAIWARLSEAEEQGTLAALKGRKDVRDPEALAGYLYWKHNDKPPNPTGKGGFMKTTSGTARRAKGPKVDSKFASRVAVRALEIERAERPRDLATAWQLARHDHVLEMGRLEGLTIPRPGTTAKRRSEVVGAAEEASKLISGVYQKVRARAEELLGKDAVSVLDVYNSLRAHERDTMQDPRDMVIRMGRLEKGRLPPRRTREALQALARHQILVARDAVRRGRYGGAPPFFGRGEYGAILDPPNDRVLRQLREATGDTLAALKGRKDVRDPETLAGYLYWKHNDKPPVVKGGHVAKMRKLGKERWAKVRAEKRKQDKTVERMQDTLQELMNVMRLGD